MNMFISKLSRQTYFAAVFGLAFGATVKAADKVEAVVTVPANSEKRVAKFVKTITVTSDAVTDSSMNIFRRAVHGIRKNAIRSYVCWMVAAGKVVKKSEVNIAKKSEFSAILKAINEACAKAVKAAKEEARKSKAKRSVVKTQIKAIKEASREEIKKAEADYVAKLVAAARALIAQQSAVVA